MTPQEQEAYDKDPCYVSRDDVEKRIKSVHFDTRDFGNKARCTIVMDNGFRTFATAPDVKTHKDAAETAAFEKAFNTVRTCMMFSLAEKQHWMATQERELSVLLALGSQEGY